MVNPARDALQTVADASFYRQYRQQVFGLLYRIDAWHDAPPDVRRMATQMLDQYDPARKFAPKEAA
jgi:hypothetical protein